MKIDPLYKLKYPIGEFLFEGQPDEEQVAGWISDIALLPEALTRVVSVLTTDQLDTPYRPGGWRVRDVIHHIGDSHMNSYIRFKLALTEDKPVIKPYDERQWAALQDYQLLPVDQSLRFLTELHKRWVVLLRLLDDSDLQRCFVHPESGATIRLDWNIGLYAWHGKHHLAHITSLCGRMGWHHPINAGKEQTE